MCYLRLFNYYRRTSVSLEAVEREQHGEYNSAETWMKDTVITDNTQIQPAQTAAVFGAKQQRY